MNLYRYVKNSPLNYTDPSGLIEKPFMQAHDATKLLGQYMNSAVDELSFAGMFPKFGYAGALYSWQSVNPKWNIKHNPEFQSLAFNPNKDNESCSDYGNSAGGSCVVYIEGVEVELSEIGNFLIGYNGMYAGFTLNNANPYKVDDIYNAGMFVEYDVRREAGTNRTYESALNDELQDRPWYDIGYEVARQEMRSKWGLDSNTISLGDAMRYGNSY